jgi:hypothetical protein
MIDFQGKKVNSFVQFVISVGRVSLQSNGIGLIHRNSWPVLQRLNSVQTDQ